MNDVLFGAGKSEINRGVSTGTLLVGESKRRGERNRRRRARELMADFLFLFHNHFSQLHNNPAVN